MSQTIDQVYRDYKTDKVPASGEHEPDKREIRALLKMIQNSGGQAVTRNTLSALNGVTPPSENYMGIVLTGSGAGYYYRSGGAWVFGRAFPDTFALMTVTGGTANAIVAGTDPALNPSTVRLFALVPAVDNTGPVTINGTALVGFDGQPLEPGFVRAGAMIVFALVGASYRLLVDHRFQQFAEQVEGWRDETEGFRDEAEVDATRAEAARDIAAGYASDAVSQGNVPIYATAVGVAALEIPEGINAFRTNGYYAAGDGGAALYKLAASEPTHAGKLQSADGRWWELAEDQPTVAMFGGGVAGIAAMASFCGLVTFPRGETIIDEEITIDYPMHFLPGAYLTVANGVTLYLTETITSPRQWIFRGDGLVRIPLPDEDSGETTRELWAIWFGAFTQVAANQAPAIQKALDALGNSREGTIHFEEGSYQIESGMTVYRGTKLMSAPGVRRVVFQIKNDGYPVFQTANTACYFNDLQFENSPTSLTRTYPFIHLLHDFCEVNNLFHQSAKHAVIMDGANCRVKNIQGVYGTSDPGADSSQVLIRANGCSAKEIKSAFSSGMGPRAIVEVGGAGAVANISSFNIEDVEYVYSGDGVLINAVNVSISRGSIRGVNNRSTGGAAVRFKTSGSGTIQRCSAKGIISIANAARPVVIEQDSSGSTQFIGIDDIQDQGTGQSGINLIHTAGTLRNINIGSNVDLRGRGANDITATGTVTGVSVAIPGRRKGKTGAWTIPSSGIDDNAFYHLQGASADVTLPADIVADPVFSCKIASSNGFNLVAATGATINGGASVSIGGNRMVQVAMTRNEGTAQWFVSPAAG